MCGFAGVLGDRRDLQEQQMLVRRMAEQIRHRGPDDQQAWISSDEVLAMASVRLSVIDPSPYGRMPMTSQSGRFTIVYNEEIYNAAELRSLLLARGIHLRGSSDTEVLLESIETLGLLSALRASVGMFAFALWDQQERRLSLCRDRFGEKPLYWARCSHTLLFGSDLEALRVHPRWSSTIDHVALHGYLRFGWITAPRTIYSEARKVLPGETLTFDSAGRLLSQESYWNLAQAVLHGHVSPLQVESDNEVDTMVEDVLGRAVQAQLMADVPVGAFLSGGIDSSLITALAQAGSSKPIRTFSIGFEESEFDEAPYARAVARHIGAEHTELQITPQDALSVIGDLPHIYGEPFADASQIPTILLSRLARRRVTVALSGDGGDEFFGGYNRYADTMRATAAIAHIPPMMRKPMGRIIVGAPVGFWNVLAAGLSPFLPRRLRSPLLEPKLRTVASWLHGSADDLFLQQLTAWANPSDLMFSPPRQVESPQLPDELQGILDPVRRMVMLDTLHYLPDDILVKMDRASMAASLETRAPFLDHRVFELVCCLPLCTTYGNGEGKRVLKRILARYIPPALTDRPKMGFGVPLGIWLRGPLRSWAEDLLSPTLLQRDGLLRAEPIHAAWKEHLSEHVDHGQALWQVLMLQAWLHRS